MRAQLGTPGNRRAYNSSFKSARPSGSCVGHVGHLDVLHGLAGMWRVDDAAASGVDAHMADAAVEEDQIAELQIGLGYRPTPAVLLSGRMRQANSNGAPSFHCQA